MTLRPTKAQVWFDYGVGLAYQLAEARRGVDCSDDLGKSVYIIFTKSMNDFLATAHLSRSGYHLPAFGTFRGGFEAIELLEYLIANPHDVSAWTNKDKRFDNLGRLRKQLPKALQRDNLYDLINNVFHCNTVESIAFVSRTLDHGGRVLITGPLKLDSGVFTPFDLLSGMISYPIRVLWSHNRHVASKEWVLKFHKFDEALKFPFGEPWTPEDFV